MGALSGDVVVRLNSGGGIAMEGSAIHNALKRHDGRVVVKIDAIAASAASLIAMAGDEIEMPLGTLLMIHEPSGMTLGPADDHRRTAGVLDTMTGVFAQVYADRTGLSEKEIRQMMKDETWMAPQEALANGFATSVSEHAPTASMADATFDYRSYAKAPDRLKRLAGERKAMGLPMVAVAAAPHIFGFVEVRFRSEKRAEEVARHVVDQKVTALFNEAMKTRGDGMAPQLGMTEAVEADVLSKANEIGKDLK
ncbi:Clp protease ClpP [Rhizobium hidalgonense]|uniref:Clp protease ClpP n=1 Tax=Rhizobium hidalgonense TaxID=1538159 RepID=A0AAJ2GX42_9HYPH|nr:head maturation protease, ClpP-related [Rhizobium hidalgonense]MDR9774118.1 Clp protease ClpP [Rhizobium hidalgonense]